jgi:hypothetical protein
LLAVTAPSAPAGKAMLDGRPFDVTIERQPNRATFRFAEQLVVAEGQQLVLS